MTRYLRGLLPLTALVAAGTLAAPAAAQSIAPLPLPGPILEPIALKPVPELTPQIRLTDCRKYWVRDKEDGTYSLQEVCFGFEVVNP